MTGWPWLVLSGLAGLAVYFLAGLAVEQRGGYGDGAVASSAGLLLDGVGGGGAGCAEHFDGAGRRGDMGSQIPGRLGWASSHMAWAARGRLGLDAAISATPECLSCSSRSSVEGGQVSFMATPLRTPRLPS